MKSNSETLFIKQIVKAQRRKKSLTMAELAVKAGVSKPIIVKIEAGDTGSRLSTLEKVFAALDYPLWKAFLLEYFDEAAPNLIKAVATRFTSGVWKRRAGEPEPLGEPEEKLVDFILREIDQVLMGQLESLPRLPDQPVVEASARTSDWSVSEKAELIEAVTQRMRPKDLASLIKMVDAIAEMGGNRP